MIQPTKNGDVDGNTLNIIEPTTNADLVVIQRDLMGTYPLVSSNMARISPNSIEVYSWKNHRTIAVGFSS